MRTIQPQFNVQMQFVLKVYDCDCVTLRNIPSTTTVTIEQGMSLMGLLCNKMTQQSSKNSIRFSLRLENEIFEVNILYR